MFKKLLSLVLMGTVLSGCALDQEDKTGAFIRDLGDPNVEVREKAKRNLFWLGGVAIPSLLTATEDKSSVVRLAACECLRKLKSGQAVDALIRLLNDEERLIQEEAALTLAEIKDTGSITRLLGLLEEGEERLRALGFRQLRLRHHGDLARIEIAPEELARAMVPEMATALVAAIKPLGFRWVSLDLEGYRTGSLNEILTISSERGSDSISR